jgi:hypothetical protein
LARLRVIGPWFIWIGVLFSSTRVTSWSMGMSASSSLSWKGVVLDSDYCGLGHVDDHCCSRI